MAANGVFSARLTEPRAVSVEVERTSVHWMAIINPFAGPQRTTRQLDELGRLLERELGAEVVITRSVAEVGELLDALGPESVAVFGGDGTVAEVVNRMDLAAQRLLPIPGGTGNGLARDLGLTSIQCALDAAREQRLATIDIVHATLSTSSRQEKRLVISTSALGYGADTVVRAKRLSRDFGPFRYPVASILQAAWAPVRAMTVALDGTKPAQMSLTNLMVNNTRHAGNFAVFRNAELFDGRLDVLIAENSFWQQVLHNLGLLAHTYSYTPGLEISTDHLHIWMGGPTRLMLDGEIWEDVREVEFAVHARQLHCYFGSEERSK
jgi:diacylglycerol kinase (ATP)